MVGTCPLPPLPFPSQAAYWFARKHAHDPRFTFGTGKIGELAGFASAVILGLVAFFIGYESVQRILAPVTITYDEAILIVVVGLGVNVLSAFLLSGDDEHGTLHRKSRPVVMRLASHMNGERS